MSLGCTQHRGPFLPEPGCRAAPHSQPWAGEGTEAVPGTCQLFLCVTTAMASSRGLAWLSWQSFACPCFRCFSLLRSGSGPGWSFQSGGNHFCSLPVPPAAAGTGRVLHALCWVCPLPVLPGRAQSPSGTRAVLTKGWRRRAPSFLGSCTAPLTWISSARCFWGRTWHRTPIPGLLALPGCGLQLRVQLGAGSRSPWDLGQHPTALELAAAERAAGGSLSLGVNPLWNLPEPESLALCLGCV